jgi:peptidylprolyl isomerase
MNVYVGNLPSDVTGNDLREAFEPFGQVETARVVKHRHGGGSRGFGFVDMPSQSEAVSAIVGLDGKNLKGRAIIANEARPKDPVCGACRTPCYGVNGKQAIGNPRDWGGQGKGEARAQARIGDTVKVHYECRLANGTVFASSIDRDPAELTIGARGIIPAFEEALVGMEPDESKTIRIPVEQALEQFRKEILPTVGQKVIAADLQCEVGQKLQAINTDERSACLPVLDVSEQTVTIDITTPLAGEDLTFDILLVEIV